MQRLLSARKRDSLPKCVMEVKGVQRQTLKFYQPRDSRLYIKITVALPTHIAPLKGASQIPPMQRQTSTRRKIKQ